MVEMRECRETTVSAEGLSAEQPPLETVRVFKVR